MRKSHSQMSRRAFLATAAATTALPRFAVAEIDLGGATLRTVSDGNLVLPGDMLFSGLPQEELKTILGNYGLSPERMAPECNVTLLRDGDRTILFDVGAGPNFQPSAGDLIDSLDAAGVAPEDVTDVIFTHAHPDHLWGLLDDFDDPLFPEARHQIGRVEWDYWWNPETVNTIGATRQSFAVGARRRMEMAEDLFEFFDDGQEVVPGISAVASYGHTPGHMAFEVHKGGAAALVLGDAVGNHHVAFEHPEWASGSDQDPETGASTRVRLMERMAQEKLAVIGFHLPGGGIGRVEAKDGAFRFVPADA